MKRVQKTTTTEFDEKGNRVRETVEEVTEEDDNGTIYPQYPRYQTPYSPYIGDAPPVYPTITWVCKDTGNPPFIPSVTTNKTE